MLVTRIPSLLIPPAGGILAGGILGNTLSAAWNGMAVPNPFILAGDHETLAFNLADVWALVGILAPDDGRRRLPRPKPRPAPERGSDAWHVEPCASPPGPLSGLGVYADRVLRRKPPWCSYEAVTTASASC